MSSHISLPPALAADGSSCAVNLVQCENVLRRIPAPGTSSYF